MALLILRNTACETSVNGLVEELRKVGNRVGWEKADQMVQLFRQAYLFFEVREFTRRLSLGGTNSPKAYAIDSELAFGALPPPPV